jgi:hypothetical protein
VECRKYRERESKKKRISWDHKDCPIIELSAGCNFSLLCRTGQLVGSRPRFLTYAATMAIGHQLI